MKWLCLGVFGDDICIGSCKLCVHKTRDIHFALLNKWNEKFLKKQERDNWVETKGRGEGLNLIYSSLFIVLSCLVFVVRFIKHYYLHKSAMIGSFFAMHHVILLSNNPNSGRQCSVSVLKFAQKQYITLSVCSFTWNKNNTASICTFEQYKCTYIISAESDYENYLLISLRRHEKSLFLHLGWCVQCTCNMKENSRRNKEVAVICHVQNSKDAPLPYSIVCVVCRACVSVVQWKSSLYTRIYVALSLNMIGWDFLFFIPHVCDFFSSCAAAASCYNKKHA